MEGRIHVVLAEVESKAFWGAVALTYISFQLTNSLFYLLLLWCLGAGFLVAYTMFRVIPRVPNLVLHKPHPPHLQRHRTPSTPKPEAQCPVCDTPHCKRHGRDEKKKEFLHPWDNLFVPASVDAALTEFFEIVLNRFVYSWHRQLAKSAEGFEDELRVYIQYAVANLLRRAQEVDLPHVISHKLLQAIASHIFICNRARRKLPVLTSITEIEAAVIQEYGDHLHTAMRGPTGNSRYFRHLVRALMPLLLPEQVLQSKMMTSFIQELFTMKIFEPAMNFVAKPDFLNKLLLIVFDKSSRLEAAYGPDCKTVLLLSSFSKRRSYTPKERPLSLSLKQLLGKQEYLYTFMNFMKSHNAIHVLQVYLTLDDLKSRVNSCTERNAHEVLAQVERLYQECLLPSSPTYLPLERDTVNQLTAVLTDPESSPMDKCTQLKEAGTFSNIRGYIYNELLMRVFYPQFCQDYKFYELHISSKRSIGATKSAAGRTGDKWRDKTSQISKRVRLKREPSEQLEDSDGRDSPSVAESRSPSPLPIPIRIKVVDAVTSHVSDGLRPYTIYYILATRRDESGSKNYLVKRRFKEFVGLDAKLHHFHGSALPSLPSKRTFRNLDKSFVDARMKELEQYLQELLETPLVREGQVLASFLDESSDPALFMPDTMGDKAGKVINNIFKNEKEPFVEELLQSLLQTVAPPQTSSAGGSVGLAVRMNRESSTSYVQQQAEDISKSETQRHKPWLRPPSLGAPVPIDSLMDLVVFVATNVYQVSSFQLTALMLVKILGQESIESLVYNFVAGRIDMMTNEQKVIQLIHLFRDNLFFNKDPPRSNEDISQRLTDTLNRLFTYPNSLVVQVIGEQRYQEGTARIVEGLQCRELNKQLFFQLLDIMILELFPELRTQE